MAPDTSGVPVPTGDQMLRVTLSTRCPADSQPLVPVVFTRITVTRTSTEWIATAASPAAGDVELRFRQSGAALGPGFLPIAGTIKGTAVHMADLLPGLPASDARFNFGAGGTAVNGVAFSPTALLPAAGVDGTGIGTITVTDGAGRSCTGSTFSWGLGAPS